MLDENPNVHVALAHDASWMKDRSDKVLMSLLDEDMTKAAKERIPKDEIP
jgi:frataxin-like iron-binding protein CyaY